MTRYPKALGFVLLAMLAMFATAASSAQAAPEFTALETVVVGKEHTSNFLLEATIDGETTVEPHVFGLSAVNGNGDSLFQCAKSTFAATMKPGVSTELTATVGYEECKTLKSGFTTDMRINGCDYKYKVEVKEIADLYKGSMSIACPAGKSIEIESTSGGKRQCLDTIPAQVGIEPIMFQDMTDSTPTDLTIIEEAKNVTNISDNGTLACGGVLIGHHADGLLFGETTITATNKGGEKVDFEVGG